MSPDKTGFRQSLDKPKARAGGFGRSPCTIYVGNMHANVTEKVLYELFLQAGPVDDVHIPPAKGRHSASAGSSSSTPVASSFGFVEMEDIDGMRYACALFNGLALYGRSLRVQPAGSDSKNTGQATTARSLPGSTATPSRTTAPPTAQARVHVVAPQRYSYGRGGSRVDGASYAPYPLRNAPGARYPAPLSGPGRPQFTSGDPDPRGLRGLPHAQPAGGLSLPPGGHRGTLPPRTNAQRLPPANGQLLPPRPTGQFAPAATGQFVAPTSHRLLAPADGRPSMPPPPWY